METTTPPAPFDRRAHRAHRARAAGTLPDHDFLFDEVGGRLLDRLDDIRRDFSAVLDLSCRGGTLATALKARGPREGLVVQADLAPQMAAAARAANGLPTVAADEEWLPFGEACFDLVISNLGLHWVNDLPGALVQVRRALRPDGLFLATLFGTGTLETLRGTLMAAEIEVEGGASPRVSPFAEVRDGGDLLARAGFALPVADNETLRVSFADPLALMRDLGAMGESTSAHARRKSFSCRATLALAAARYPRLDDGRIEAEFNIITLTAWAPGPGQQKPLRPGSAAARLADHLGTPERPAGDKAPNPGKS
jgi:NADH dehydrogenase [ubiquinone] 1 alpha subcomplex assembly factor 5